jgi:putative copper resistance protein D
MSALDGALVVTRFVQYAAASLAGGAALFALYGRGPARLGAWVRAAAIVGALATLGWLMAQAGTLGDGAADAFNPARVWTVAAATGFGRAALARTALFALAAIWPGRAAAAFGLLAAASFAWTGHGAMDDGVKGLLHQGADVVHLVAAAVWIGALGALSLLALERDAHLADAMRAFSGLGAWVVAAILASGLVNGALLVGLSGVAHLPESRYGQLLIVKLALFAGMLGLAAHNRWRVTPRLAFASSRAALAPVLTETLFAVAVLAAVAWMGTLPPPIHMAG